MDEQSGTMRVQYWGVGMGAYRNGQRDGLGMTRGGAASEQGRAEAGEGKRREGEEKRREEMDAMIESTGREIEGRALSGPGARQTASGAANHGRTKAGREYINERKLSPASASSCRREPSSPAIFRIRSRAQRSPPP